MPNDKIHTVNGDALNVQKSIICHQVNCLGIMPYRIACGLGGGNWNIVYQILSDTAKYFDYDISLYKKIMS